MENDKHKPIFSAKELRTKSKMAFPNGIPNREQKIKIVRQWQEMIHTGKADRKEEELKPIFLPLFFGEILGYDYKNAHKWHLQLENKSETDSTKADAALGFFSIVPNPAGAENQQGLVKQDVRAVIEIKDSKEDFNTHKKDSAVSQAFSYVAKSGERCKWVILSNFKEIRLYASHDATKFEKFVILELDGEDEFDRFYYLLANGQLFFEKNISPVDTLLANRIERERIITQEFYEKYTHLREIFVQHLKLHNPQHTPLDLLQYAQTIIDRVIFVSVIKDYELIRFNTLKKIKEISEESWANDQQELWRQLKYLFRALDKGIPKRIEAFNGGLFRHNPLIDELVVKDVFMKQLLELNQYDFESDLNINILGHIFEQSISDIENLKIELLEGKQVEYSETDEEIVFENAQNSTGLRKKDGIFYTPEYVTAYMIENSLGEWLEEQKEKIGLNDESENLALWERYAEILQSVKILDPACGSGAFLTQTFDFLFAEWTFVFTAVKKIKGEILDKNSIFSKTFTQIKKDIISNNLFGVDLNYESVEITKLGLWLKSASKSDPLALLDDNIKVGNSLISDPAVSEKAFDWEKEFAEIRQNGGFDLIVGNPPYVESKRLKPYSEYFAKNYNCYAGTADLYVYFYELGYKLLKPSGLLNFISSNKFMKTGYGENLRQLLANQQLIQIIDFTDYRVFEDALVASSIVLFRKSTPQEQIKVCFVKQDLQEFKNLKEYISAKHFWVKSANLDKEIWFLSANGKLPLKRKIEENSTKLKNLQDVQIFRGVTTGYNEAFIIDVDTRKRLIKENSKNAELIKPLLQGRNIRKWFYEESNLYMIFTRKGIDISQYKAIEQYLSTFKNHLEAGKGRKAGSYQWYEIQDNTAYYPEFEKPKIIWGLTADKWAYCYDDKGHFLPSNGYLLTSEKVPLFYILGILNSRLMRFYFNFIGIMTAGGAFTLKYDTIAEFPFREVSPENQAFMTEKVSQILALQKDLRKTQSNFLELVEANFQVPKISRKLEKWYEFDKSVFLQELEKQKVEIPMRKQKDFFEFFTEEQESVKTLSFQIQSLENEIDSLVFEIYGLTEEEIKIVENG